MPEGLKIQVGADVQQAVKGLKQLETQVENTFKKTGNVFSPAISKGATSLDKYTKSSNTATQATLNLSRVVQDAPFGFIGIANNLNPLLESFQRLKAESGSNKTALKSLAGSLTGAGGLGLALSVASSLAIVFSDKIFGAGKAAKETATAADQLKDSIKGIFGEVGKEAAQITSLVAVLKSETETRQRKLAAIKELQSLQPEIFNNLKIEGQAVAGLDAAYSSYLGSLKTVIAAKIVQAKLEQLITKQLVLQGVEQTETVKGLFRALDQLNARRLKTAQGDPSQQGNIISQILGDKKSREDELSSVQRDIDAAFKELVGFSKGIELKGAGKINLDKIKPGEIEKEFIAKFPKLTIPVRMQPTIDEGNIKFVLLGGVNKTFKEIFEERINKDIQNLVVTPKIYLSPEALKNIADQKEILEFAENTASIFNNTLSQGLSSGISGFAEGIGKALTGGGIGDAFNAFFSAIGGAIQSMGEQLIAIGVAALLAKSALETLFANPLVAIAAGAALVVAGAALKSLLSGGVKGFASGGYTGDGAKNEIAGVVHKGEYVLSQDMLRNLGGNRSQQSSSSLAGMLTGMGGGSQVVVMRTIVRGNNLALVQARTSRSQKRTTGR